MKKYGIKRTKSDIAMDTICVIFLTILFIITFYPFWYVFIASINDPMDTMKGGLSLLPRVLNFSAYGVIMKDKGVKSNNRNTSFGIVYFNACICAYKKRTCGI